MGASPALSSPVVAGLHTQTLAFLSTVKELLFRERWTICLFLAAAVVRMHWNESVHPPGDYLYSDMRGYDLRADQFLDDPFGKREYAAFFPFGTHWLLAAFKLLVGRDNYAAMSFLLAGLGALNVALAFLVARRATRFAIVPPAVGLMLVFYYPWISYGGYLLSETPYTTFFMASVFFLLRLVQVGKTRDALFAGLFMAIGSMIRPQLLVSGVLFGAYWLATRRHLPTVNFKKLLWAGIPILLAVGGASYRLHHHTGRYGVVSENGTLNYMFGRCHCSRIESQPDGLGHGRVHFRPPPYLQMRAEVRKNPNLWPQLRPALGYEIKYKGYIGDSKIHLDYVRKCVKKTGVWGQVEYAVTNVVLLWYGNIPWPDSGKPEWKKVAEWWNFQHLSYFTLGSLLGLLALFRPKQAMGQALVALNVVALIIIAAIFFGGARVRTPYDGLMIFLAFETYVTAGYFVLTRVWARRRS